jgi:hypothetical protein
MYVCHVIDRLICYDLVVLAFAFYFLFQSLQKSPVVMLSFFSIPSDGCLFSCSEALMGSQRTSVTLRNVACVPSLWLLSWKEATTLPRSRRRGFLFIKVSLMVPVDVGGRVRDIYIVQDHQLSGFYVLACILSIHWAMVYRPLKALKYGKSHIKCTFFWNLFNHTLMSNTYLFVIKDNYLPGGVVIFLLNYYFRIQNVLYNISWNQHDKIYFQNPTKCSK